LTPDQFNYARLGILKDSALETRPGAEARKGVQLTERSLGFHKVNDLTKTPSLNVTGFQSAFTIDK
jgi:hypothetical protein